MVTITLSMNVESALSRLYAIINCLICHKLSIQEHRVDSVHYVLQIVCLQGEVRNKSGIQAWVLQLTSLSHGWGLGQGAHHEKYIIFHLPAVGLLSRAREVLVPATVSSLQPR